MSEERKDKVRELPVGIYERRLKGGGIRYQVQLFYYGRKVHGGLYLSVREAVASRLQDVRLLEKDEEAFVRKYPSALGKLKKVEPVKEKKGPEVDFAKVMAAVRGMR